MFWKRNWSIFWPAAGGFFLENALKLMDFLSKNHLNRMHFWPKNHLQRAKFTLENVNSWCGFPKNSACGGLDYELKGHNNNSWSLSIWSCNSWSLISWPSCRCTTMCNRRTSLEARITTAKSILRTHTACLRLAMRECSGVRGQLGVQEVVTSAAY